MSTIDTLDTSPVNQLSRVRGVIEQAQEAYAETLHVDVRDGEGELWHLVTWDADWAPSDAASLVGRTVCDTVLEPSGRLTWQLSEGPPLVVSPRPPEGDDDPPYWELLTPAGLSLEFGPGSRWQVSASST